MTELTAFGPAFVRSHVCHDTEDFTGALRKSARPCAATRWTASNHSVRLRIACPNPLLRASPGRLWEMSDSVKVHSGPAKSKPARAIAAA
ncbi:MAG: hypothetical protein H7144_03475 [Burkholderiales bacterium]|nr:hypothetical protein [Phycisphaerae bacterium]